MSISRLVARNIAQNSTLSDQIADADGNILSPDLTMTKTIAGAQRPAPTPTPAPKNDAIPAILEVLSRYFPAEILAIYLFGLSGLGTVAKDLCGPTAQCTSITWWSLMGICVVLTAFFVTLSWLAARKTDATLAYPSWPLAASLIAFVIWALATPGNPLITTGGAALLAGFVALTSSHVLAGLETILGSIKRSKTG